MLPNHEAKPTGKSLYICLFRRNLRLHDNSLLLQAERFADLLLPLYIIDPNKTTLSLSSPNRLGFLLESLEDLDINLKWQYNQRLFVTFGQPMRIVQELIRAIREDPNNNISEIILGMEKDFQPYEKVRDQTLTNWARSEEIKVQMCTSQTLYNMDLLFEQNHHKTAQSFADFQNLIDSIGSVIEPNKVPERLPEKPSWLIHTSKNSEPEIIESYGNVKFFNYVPQIEQLGMNFKRKDFSSSFKGGESTALRRVERLVENHLFLLKFADNLNNPTHHHPQTTTLSPYLANGSLSTRLFYYSIQKAINKFESQFGPQSSILLRLIKIRGSLIWREFFYFISSFTNNFDRMLNNTMSKLTDCWDYEDHYINAWKEGKTGYPVIDAAMRQLKKDGWIHSLHRQLVAFFLTKGGLWQTWEVGLKHFQTYLIDFDWSINTANWIWVSNKDFSKGYTEVIFFIFLKVIFNFYRLFEVSKNF